MEKHCSKNWERSWDQKTQDNSSTLQNDCYKMAFWARNRKNLKPEFHVLEPHRSFQEPDVLWRFKQRTDWYPKKWTWCFTYWGNQPITFPELSLSALFTQRAGKWINQIEIKKTWLFAFFTVFAGKTPKGKWNKTSRGICSAAQFRCRQSSGNQKSRRLAE